MAKQILTFVVFAIVIVGIGFGATKLFLRFKKEGKAGLKVLSMPQASVFLNNDLKGKTPFEGKFTPGEYKIKLIPEGTDLDTSSWQDKITLTSGVTAYINMDLGASELTSAGEILNLEKKEGNGSQVSVISEPDGASVAIDGEEKGSSPLVIDDISPGDHILFVFAPGFKERQVKINIPEGYKLNAKVKLALVEGRQATESADTKDKGSSEQEEKSGYIVKILDTPTGWLRVREEPTLSASEAAKVDPGSEFPFLGEEEGWFKIEYKDGKEGWVSSRYAEKLEK